ncbi:MAG: hypothetical protein ACLRFI_02405, partial [Alphaproteobacteria bacterium]
IYDGYGNGSLSGVFADVMFGYKTEYGISPEIGIRYNNIKINQTNSNLEKAESDLYNVVGGINYEYLLNKFKIGGKFMLVYDVIRPNDKVYLDVLGYKYKLKINNIDSKLNTELGFFAGYDFVNINLQLNYDLKIYLDMLDHTGGLSIKYYF